MKYMNMKIGLDLCRAQQGVWAQLGKPYECLGVPCITISKECPMPELGNYGIDINEDEEKASFQFFKELGVVEAHKRAQIQDEELVPLFKKKKEMVLQYAQTSANMARMLIKMGLMHFHGNKISHLYLMKLCYL
jgi:hypothetical protein